VFEGITLSHTRCTKDGLLLPVEIDGTRGWFILDSGAFVNVVYEGFARRAHLALQDHADRIGGGAGVRVLEVAPRSLVVPGLPDHPALDLVMLSRDASPLARETCDVAGVISPALLADHGSALLVDFATRRLARVPTTSIEAYLDRVGGQRFVATTHDDEYAPGIDVAFGDRSLRMMVDTGSSITWVATSSEVGRAHLPRSVSSGRIDRLLGTTSARAVRTDLQFGDVARTLEVTLLEPDAGDARESGGIGADALRSCVVAIGQHEMRGSCR